MPKTNNQLPEELEHIIECTFSHFQPLKTGGQCLHDSIDNCYQTIEDVRFAARETAIQAYQAGLKHSNSGKLNYQNGYNDGLQAGKAEERKDILNGIKEVRIMVYDDGDWHDNDDEIFALDKYLEALSTQEE